MVRRNKIAEKEVRGLFRFRLLAKRKALELSVREVASAVGISPSYYYRIERGKSNPSIKVRKAIGRFFGEQGKDFFREQDIYLAPHLYYDKLGRPDSVLSRKRLE